MVGARARDCPGFPLTTRDDDGPGDESGKVPRTLGTAAYGRLFAACFTIHHVFITIRPKSRRREIMATKKNLASRKVERAMHEMKRGELKSGRSGKKVKDRKQAIAIGLSEARKSGAKISKKKNARKK